MRLPLAAAVLLSSSLASGETHRLKPAAGHATFAVRPPVLTVKPGDVVESESLWGDWYEKDGGRWPGEVGPIAIEGAEPGDTLVVEILKVRPNRDTAVSTQGRSFGALVPDSGTAMLNEPLPRTRHVWKLDRTRMTGTLEMPGSRLEAVTVPLAPMLGRVAVAPAGEEAFGGLWPGPFGGNMDAADVKEGTTVRLPVFHEGALFYFGDGHALQGDGELCGSGLETTMEVAFRFSLEKGRRIAWPRFEDAEHIMVAGSARPLTDAVRIAAVEMVRWLETEHGFLRDEAHQLLSQVGSLRVAQMVDPLYTAVSRFPKRYLPGPRAAAARAGVRLAAIPWTEAERVLAPDTIVVLPLGAAAKEHGPHLTLGNDAILADHLADRVVEARPVALLPTLTYGYYSPFLEYPGSTSLSFATQVDVVTEIVRSIARFGPRRFYVLNTGVRTARPLAATVARLAAEGILLRFTDVKVAGKAAEDRVRQQAFGTHADEIETSMVLYMRPSAVRMDLAVKDGERQAAGPLTRDPENREGHYSPSGVFGDPTLATWHKGHAVVEAMVADILKDIDALAGLPLPAGTPRSPLERDAAAR